MIIRKINLEMLIDCLLEVKETGVNYIDIVGDIFENNDKITIVAVDDEVRFSNDVEFNEDDIDELI